MHGLDGHAYVQEIAHDQHHQNQPVFGTAAEVELATFYVADLLLGIPIHEVEEISRYCAVTPVPGAGVGLRRDEPARRSRDRAWTSASSSGSARPSAPGRPAT